MFFKCHFTEVLEYMCRMTYTLLEGPEIAPIIEVIAIVH